MKYVSGILVLIGGFCILSYFGKEYYKAIRHEFYQVWDTISEMKGEKDEAS